jgi:hypothetical protein
MSLEPLAVVSAYAYTSPKLEVRSQPQKDGLGLFACEPIQKGELLTVWSGIIVDDAGLLRLPEPYLHRTVQVEEGLYQVSLRTDEPADYGNHSCNPNAGMSGQIALVAMRDIDVDEEVCYDYAMSESSDYDEFDCHCGAPNCRGRITGEDWRLPELWSRYDGYFSPYLQRKIDALRAEARARRRWPAGIEASLRGRFHGIGLRRRRQRPAPALG